MSLTATQMKAKKKVESAGQVFLPPSQYKAMMAGKAKPKYSKSAVKTNPQQVASYTARKAYKRDFKEISPDTDLLVDQMLNPDGCNEITRWPNTYGLSAVYKCNTIINPNFGADNICCVVVNPTIRDAIMYTSGTVVTQYLVPWGSSNAVNPYSEQNFSLTNNLDDVYWSSPIIFAAKHAVLPVPNSQNNALLYPIQFDSATGGIGTDPISMSFRFPEAIAAQVGITVQLYDTTYEPLFATPITGVIGSVGSPDGMGLDIDLLDQDASILGEVRYISILIEGQNQPYYGPGYLFFYSTATTVDAQPRIQIPNVGQHVVIQDIKDADTIDQSADQAFMLSQSVLITSNMSDLQNGGVIAIARIPGSAVVGGGDAQVDSNSWYDWISSLSHNQYDGPVKKGAYSWYLPDDETGFFYRPISAAQEKSLPYIVSSFTNIPTTDGTTPTAANLSMRIKVTSIVQFTTTSSVYDCRPSCRISENDFMHHILSLIQASYSNDGHKGGLKSALKSVGGQVVKLLKNPKTYTTVADIIGGLGKALV